MSRRRPRRWLLVGLAVLDVVVLGGGVFVATTSRVATQVTLDDALAEFRTTRAVAVVDPVAGSPSAALSSSPSAATSPSAKAAVRSASPKAVAGSAAAVAVQPVAPPSPAGPYLLPAEGVYAYDTKGSESISIGGSHQYPSETFATLRHLTGCQWTIRNDILKEHTDTRTFCGRVSALLQVSQQRSIEFFGKRETIQFVCHPALPVHRVGDKPGTRATTTCSDGGDNQATLRIRLVGTEQMKVGGVRVPVVHAVIDSSFTGTATGTAVDELWVDARNGLTIRWDRSVDTDTNAVFGANVHYTENVSFVLKSLTPQT